MQIDKLNLDVGKTYLAIMKGCEVELDDRTVVFDDEIIEVKILPKPENVMVDGGSNGSLVKEKLSGHLLESHWYFVEHVENSKTRWLSVLHREIE
ncbi:hypothetical protein [Moritella yayanosii]|uniref:Uncharacterized protein n=1 Tax=Moritella yayanosii TaxID=69539 RepID=A0A330LXJ4_9GAMM|nr:hypothetical protein [Moritella yayanosii]SQD80428.1 conserved protein of unknown function [Moritella yayanosii]